MAQPKREVSPGPGRRMVCFSPPCFSFLLDLKVLEEKVLISGTEEAPRPWRVDLVVQYYKICFRKKPPRPLSSSPSIGWSSGPTSPSRQGRVITGHWCRFMMEQHKIFLPCEHEYEHSPFPKALQCYKEAAESNSWAQSV